MDKLYSQNHLWFEKAEALGWQDPPADFDQKYLESINKQIQLRTAAK